jgi:hypothetical protein
MPAYLPATLPSLAALESAWGLGAGRWLSASYASVLTASKIGGLLFVLLILALILESDKLQDVWDAMRTWKRR